MGTYIAHKRRKIRRPKSESPTSDAGRSQAVKRQLALRRETETLELERARAAKMVRASERLMKRRTIVVNRTSGRQRTAVRVAGTVVISATVRLRTRSVSIQRLPNSAPTELWAANIRFENEEELAYRFNDAMIPASVGVMHLMRYAAPRIAEEIHMGSAPAGADDNNNETVLRLAESCLRKVFKQPSLSDGDKHELVAAIVSDLEATAALRLQNYHAELMRMVDTLMRRTHMSRRECEGTLFGIYAGFESFRTEKTRPYPCEPLRVIKASREIEAWKSK